MGCTITFIQLIKWLCYHNNLTYLIEMCLFPDAVVFPVFPYLFEFKISLKMMTSWTDMLDRFWDSSIDLIILINLSICILHRDYLVGIMRLGQAEQNCTLCLHIISCLYCAVQLPGTSLASVLSTNHRRASWTASTNHIAPNLLIYPERSQIIVGRLSQMLAWYKLIINLLFNMFVGFSCLSLFAPAFFSHLGCT